MTLGAYLNLWTPCTRNALTPINPRREGEGDLPDRRPAFVVLGDEGVEGAGGIERAHPLEGTPELVSAGERPHRIAVAPRGLLHLAVWVALPEACGTGRRT